MSDFDEFDEVNYRELRFKEFLQQNMLIFFLSKIDPKIRSKIIDIYKSAFYRGYDIPPRRVFYLRRVLDEEFNKWKRDNYCLVYILSRKTPDISWTYYIDHSFSDGVRARKRLATEG